MYNNNIITIIIIIIYATICYNFKTSYQTICKLGPGLEHLADIALPLKALNQPYQTRKNLYKINYIID